MPFLLLICDISFRCYFIDVYSVEYRICKKG